MGQAGSLKSADCGDTPPGQREEQGGEQVPEKHLKILFVGN